jgi:microcompartment protein CcmK/EutM
MEGMVFLIVRQLDADNVETGSYVVAVDTVGAGPGEVVLFASGSSARQTEMTRDRPVDAVIMAIVDSWDVGGEVRYHKGREESPTGK